MSKATTQAPEQAPVIPSSSFVDSDMVILTPMATARCTAAMQAIRTLSGMISQQAEAALWDDDAPELSLPDLKGMVSAIEICALFAEQHIGGKPWSTTIDRSDPEYEALSEKVHADRMTTARGTTAASAASRVKS